MNNKKSYVYKITCKINGEFYFGSSFNAKRDSYWGYGRKIKERIAQYGKENFIKEILEEFDDRVEAHKKENQYIEKFRHDDKCLNERIEYHFGLYGEESRAKNRAAQRGEKSSWYGKHHTEEVKARISAAMLGKHLSEETRSKLSVANRGEKNPMYGKIFSEEHRAKLSAVHLGKHLSEEHKAKIGAAHRVENLSDDTRAKLSAAHRVENLSDDTRAKLSAAHLGKHWRKNPVTGKREWYE